MVIDGLFAAVMAAIVAKLAQAAWSERHDAASCAVGFGLAGVLALIVLRLLFK